jgi:hypothetical protein
VKLFILHGLLHSCRGLNCYIRLLFRYHQGILQHTTAISMIPVPYSLACVHIYIHRTTFTQPPDPAYWVGSREREDPNSKWFIGFTYFHYQSMMSRDSAVGIATSYGLDREVGVRVPVGSSRPALGSTQIPIQWVPGLKRPWCEADHSPPTSSEVKKTRIYTSTPRYVFMA